MLNNEIALEHFIQFGGVGNEKSRRELARQLNDVLAGFRASIEIADEDMKPYLASVNQMLSKEVKQFCQENPAASIEIAQMILENLNATAKTVKANPYKKLEEEKYLESTSANEKLKEIINKFEEFKNTCSDLAFYKEKRENLSKAFYELKTKIDAIQSKYENKNQTLKNLKGKLDPLTGKLITTEELLAQETAPFEAKMEELKKEMEYLKTSFLELWEKIIFEKKMKYELALIDKARKHFLEELFKKMEEFNQLKKLLSPLVNDFGRLWDLSNGFWKKTNFNAIQKYAATLENNPQLKELIDLLGKLRQQEIEYEEETITKYIHEPVICYTPDFKAEYVGVRESSDIAAILPSELTFLSDTATDSIFFKKFAEGKLQTFDYRSRANGFAQKGIDETIKKSKEVPKGPIIICVDTSGSMQGTPEMVAKTLAFAIIKTALKEKRNCYLISFSTSIQTINLIDLTKSLEKLVEFLSFSFQGGTDATLAFQEAIRMFDKNDYQKADLLMITDGIMKPLPKTEQNKILEYKNKNNKFYSLIIGSSSNPKFTNDFDENWIYDPNQPSKLIDTLRKLSRH